MRGDGRPDGIEGEPVSTQVVARDHHAELLQAVALAGAGLERLATEIRHLQRTEVREVEEPFRAGQKGSSAMVVHSDRMLENVGLTYGALFSQRVLLSLVSSGMTRDEAYRVAQELAQRAWDTRVPLRELLEARPELDLDLVQIFDLGHYACYAEEIVGRLDGDG